MRGAYANWGMENLLRQLNNTFHLARPSGQHDARRKEVLEATALQLLLHQSE
jgi:hypothetical protein